MRWFKSLAIKLD